MNSYRSVLRTFRARNMVEAAISPPANQVIADSDWVSQILNNRALLISPQSNFTIKRLGIFANFADGLVFADPSQRLNISIFVKAYTRTTVVGGDISLTLGSKAATGNGFTGNIADQNILVIPYVGTQEQYFIVDGDPASDNDLNVTDYAESDATTVALVKLVGLPTYQRVEFTRISELNYMYDFDEFVSPLAFSSVAATDIVLLASINNNGFDFEPSDTAFLTKSISTDYDGDILHVDLVADIEYTPQ